MDTSDLHSLSTVLVFIAFIGVCWWAFAPRRKERFNEAANLPFADEDSHERAQNSHERENSLERTQSSHESTNSHDTESKQP